MISLIALALATSSIMAAQVPSVLVNSYYPVEKSCQSNPTFFNVVALPRPANISGSKVTCRSETFGGVQVPATLQKAIGWGANAFPILTPGTQYLLFQRFDKTENCAKGSSTELGAMRYENGKCLRTDYGLTPEGNSIPTHIKASCNGNKCTVQYFVDSQCQSGFSDYFLPSTVRVPSMTNGEANTCARDQRGYVQGQFYKYQLFTAGPNDAIKMMVWWDNKPVIAN
jgi:hypothetical protein